MITIRNASLSDIDQLSKLFDEYRIFYLVESDLPGAKAFLSERIKNKDSEIFVAVKNAKFLVGFVQLYPLFSSTRLKRLWLLNDLYVSPGSRGQNISVMLIDKAKELSRQTNSAGLILETAKSNIIGNKLYPRTDFVLDEEHNFYSWENGGLSELKKQA